MQARDSTRSRSSDRYCVEFEMTSEVSHKENLLLLSQRFKKTRENVLFRPGVKPQGFTVPTTSSQIMFNLIHDFKHDTHVLDLDTALKFQQLGLEPEDPSIMQRCAATSVRLTHTQSNRN